MLNIKRTAEIEILTSGVARVQNSEYVVETGSGALKLLDYVLGKITRRLAKTADVDILKGKILSR